MAKIIQEVNVVVRMWNEDVSHPGKVSPGKVSVESWSKPERTKRALKAWGLGWCFAVASVFLPIAHFILVPAFLIGSPIVAYFISKQKSVILGGQSVCPSCGKTLEIVKGPENLPLEDVCTGCQNHVHIQKKDIL
jgi:hypothetical protein